MIEIKIYLIGMPLSGKSSVAKKLAEKLNYQLVDIETEIEKEALMFIDEIYALLDIETVRQSEINILNKLLNQNENIVVATTSDVVEKRKNKKLLDGLVIYLDTDNEVIEKRLKTSYKKFLYQGASVEELAQRRFLKYQNFANHIVSSNKSVDETVDEILKIVT